MSVIVAGSIVVKPGTRDAFLQASIPAVEQARNNADCLDFSVSPDPLAEDRVNVFEQWTSADALTQFRENGPDSDITSLIVSASVKEFRVVEDDD